MADSSQRNLMQMVVSAINVRETESHRISRVLHDDVGQVLTAVGLQLDVLRLDFKDQLPDLVERTREIQKILDGAVQRVRELSYDLNPAVVERAGLHAAIDRLVGRFRTGFDGSIRFLFDSSQKIPLPAANAWYKITELALDNAVKHAHAGHIEVHVRPTLKGNTLEVRDNGDGFSLKDARLKSAGLGLILMGHYASQGSVEIDIKSTPGKGTTVRSIFQLPGDK